MDFKVAKQFLKTFVVFLFKQYCTEKLLCFWKNIFFVLKQYCFEKLLFFLLKYLKSTTWKLCDQEAVPVFFSLKIFFDFLMFSILSKRNVSKNREKTCFFTKQLSKKPVAYFPLFCSGLLFFPYESQIEFATSQVDYCQNSNNRFAFLTYRL